MAKERGAFDFETVARQQVDKLIRRHPHVFGKVKVKNVDEVWANWEKIKRAEKLGTHRERKSALDGIPKHLPALLRGKNWQRKLAKPICWRKIPVKKFHGQISARNCSRWRNSR